MAVNISNATYGYDASGVKSFITQIKLRCVTNTIASMQLGLNTLNQKVDNCWKGASAMAFKNKMDSDCNAVKKALNEAANTMEATIAGGAQAISDLDQSITF